MRNFISDILIEYNRHTLKLSTALSIFARSSCLVANLYKLVEATKSKETTSDGSLDIVQIGGSGEQVISGMKAGGGITIIQEKAGVSSSVVETPTDHKPIGSATISDISCPGKIHIKQSGSATQSVTGIHSDGGVFISQKRGIHVETTDNYGADKIEITQSEGDVMVAIDNYSDREIKVSQTGSGCKISQRNYSGFSHEIIPVQCTWSQLFHGTTIEVPWQDIICKVSIPPRSQEGDLVKLISIQNIKFRLVEIPDPEFGRDGLNIYAKNQIVMSAENVDLESRTLQIQTIYGKTMVNFDKLFNKHVYYTNKNDIPYLWTHVKLKQLGLKSVDVVGDFIFELFVPTFILPDLMKYQVNIFTDAKSFYGVFVSAWVRVVKK